MILMQDTPVNGTMLVNEIRTEDGAIGGCALGMVEIKRMVG